MITWREEGERASDHHFVAVLGEVNVGYVFERRTAWDWFGPSMVVPGSWGSAPTLPAAKEALERAVAEWCARAGLVKDEGWRPMAEAKKDRTPIWVLFRSDISASKARRDLEAFDGIQACVKHCGLADDGFDIGWNMAAPVGCGGLLDDWFVGWRPLPAPPERNET